MSVPPAPPTRLAVLTSGGDSAGMNPAVRAVVRRGLDAGLEVFAVYDGLQGLVDGGDHIRPMSSADVSGILQEGGTFIGTARSDDFRTRDGRRRAAGNLAELGIDALVVIGGDGSLTGIDVLRSEWPELLDELVADARLDAAVAERHGRLAIVGLAGSIDNDMFGTDMTIGADTALHRITEAVDALQSTASSHQRTFVIEVMGRRCGYLALMGSLATGANFVLVPENPPGPGWEEAMCDTLAAGRRIGRRASIVLVAEGAIDTDGQRIDADHVKGVLEDRLGEDVRVTILGHVQRGGSPSAFDRYLGTVLGDAAVRRLVDEPDVEPELIGISGHRVSHLPLMDCVETTRAIGRAVADRDEAAMSMRGDNFTDADELLRTLVRARPTAPASDAEPRRIAVLHAGGPAPGMNTAVRVALRVAMNRGHQVLGVRDGFRGLLDGRVEPMDWMSVSGWVSRPGAELGTNRQVPAAADLEHLAERFAAERIDGLLMIGGFAGYRAAHAVTTASADHPELAVPIVCVPASINNDLPGSDLSIGSDTALNSIVSDVDKIKQSAVASQRCFVVEVMGHDSGYLALMSGLATGAERVYLPEEGITLEQLNRDLETLRRGFALGKRRGLVIRSEFADAVYTTRFIASLFGHESDGLYDAREAILGHVQQGGSPTPFDRIQATRLASAAVGRLMDRIEADDASGSMIGLVDGAATFTPLDRFPALVEADAQRPASPQWWMALRALADVMAAAR